MSVNRLSVVAFQEAGPACTARCLERDIAATGRTIEFAVDTLMKLVRAHIEFDLRHGRPPLSAFVPAPKLYWDAFRRGSQRSGFAVQSGLGSSPARTIQIDVVSLPQHPAIPLAAGSRIA